MNENQNTEQKSTKLEWEELWETTKRWAVMSQWTKDLENYETRQQNLQSGNSGSE